MKQLFTLFVAFVATVLGANAKPGSNTPMTFVGKSNFFVTMMGKKAGETTQLSDTIIYSGADFTLPSMKYNDMTIPSFKIIGTTFSGGYAGVTWEDQTFTSTAIDSEGVEKNITGTSLKGTFTHANGIYKVSLEVSFNYGTMPFPITYSIESYYVKEYSGTNAVMVGGVYGPHKAEVTYKVRTYVEDGVTLKDVEIPTYKLDNTEIGNLTIGGYTVKGLALNEDKGGYYRDYTSDNITMHFKAEGSFDSDYTITKLGNVLVTDTEIVNNFQPGAMPFPISSTTTLAGSTEIKSVTSTSVSEKSEASYNLNGQRVAPNARGLIIKNGKKYFVR